MSHGFYSKAHAADVDARSKELRAFPRPVLRVRAVLPKAGPIAGAKHIHFIRHGEGHHNVAQREWLQASKDGMPYDMDHDPDFKYLDAQLTDEGERQAAALQDQCCALQAGLSLLVVSPMRRALKTGLIAFDQVQKNRDSEGGARLQVIAHEACHEIGGFHTCDRRLPRAELQKAYPQVDFSLIADEEDPLWGDGRRRETLQEVATRAAIFVAWLLSRPEESIAVACHSTFLLGLFNGALELDPEGGADAEALCSHFHTGELRSVLLVPM
jgi:broad specificity phosphatase PhoE